jgi:hypothetical protein
MVKDPQYLHNVFEPWPLPSTDDASRLPEDGSIAEHPMKETSLMYAILQPLIVTNSAVIPSPQQQQHQALSLPKHELTLARDISDTMDDFEDADSDAGGVDEKQTDHASNPATAASTVLQKRLKLVAWDKNDGHFKLAFYGNDASSSDNAIGVAKIPIKDLLNDPKHEYLDPTPLNDGLYSDPYDIAFSGLQKEVCGWFPIVKDKKTGRSISPNQAEDENKQRSRTDSHDFGVDETMIQVQLRLQLDIRSGYASRGDIEVKDKDLSKALQYLFYHQEDQRGSNSTITALWNMRDHITYVQNLMSWLLDIIESFKNIFNWTTPSKTFILYIAMIALWLTSIIIPGRYLILMVGLHQFFYKFLPDPDGKQMLQKLYNLMQSLPNDDDLRQLYHDERVAFIESEKRKQQERLKRATIGLLLPCLWDGTVIMKLSSSLTNHASSSVSHNQFNPAANINSSLPNNDWEEYYLLLQGHRLVWWLSEKDLAEGQKPCEGQLLLHNSGSTTSGIAQTSPVDIKEMKDPKRLLAIFGSDEHGMPLKCTIFFYTVNDCMQFHDKISTIL